MFVLSAIGLVAVATVIGGRGSPRTLAYVGLVALAFGVVALDAAMASHEWLLLYLAALTSWYGLAVLFGFLLGARGRRNAERSGVKRLPPIGSQTR